MKVILGTSDVLFPLVFNPNNNNSLFYTLAIPNSLHNENINRYYLYCILIQLIEKQIQLYICLPNIETLGITKDTNNNIPITNINKLNIKKNQYMEWVNRLFSNNVGKIQLRQLKNKSLQFIKNIEKMESYIRYTTKELYTILEILQTIRLKQQLHIEIEELLKIDDKFKLYEMKID